MPETVQPPKPETKPPAPPPKEAPKQEKPAKAPEGTARATLEKIAAGTPVLEATATPVLPAGRQENLPSREETDAILKETSEILLELRDMRLLVNAIATQAADTPLGNEVRLDALRSLEKMNTIGLPPDQAAQLNALQEKIKAWNLPPSSNDATLAIIATYNEQHPDNKIPQSVIDTIQSGDKTAAESVAQLLQTNNDLAALTWKQLTNTEGFTKLNLSPGIVLNIAGLPRTKKNEEKAAELFGAMKPLKEPPPSFKEQLGAGAMYGALAIMFFSQIALGQEGGSH